MVAVGGRLELAAQNWRLELSGRHDLDGQKRPWELASRESLVIARRTSWGLVEVLVTKGLRD